MPELQKAFIDIVYNDRVSAVIAIPMRHETVQGKSSCDCQAELHMQ